MPNKASGERGAPTGREIGGGGRKDRWPERQEKRDSEEVLLGFALI